MSYDPVAPLKRFSNRRSIGFTLLSDPKSEIITAFNLLNNGYAHPMILVVNEKGVVNKRFFESHYTDRPSVDTVLKTLR